MKTILRLVFAAAALLAGAASALAQNQDTTIYQLPSDPLAQISGFGTPTLKPTYAATVTINPARGIVHQISGSNTVSATTTVNAASKGNFGQLLITIVSADSTGTVTATFGTNFLPTATAAPTSSKSITVAWVSDGVAWHEFARSASAQ